jgi:hypothetical protein
MPFTVREKQPRYGGIGMRLIGRIPIARDSNGHIMMNLTDGQIEQYNTWDAFSLLSKIERANSSQYRTLLNEREKEDLDFFLSLHKHAIDTDVLVDATPLGISPVLGQQREQSLRINRWRIKFVKWKNTVNDKYDFNPEVGFTLPNPDFESQASYAIMASKKMISYRTLKHEYLDQFQREGLASIYKVNGTWEEEHEEIKGDAEIDCSHLR